MTIAKEFIFNPEDLRKLIAKLFLPRTVQVFASNKQINTTNIPFYVTVQRTSSVPQGSRAYQDEVTETQYSKVTNNVLYSIQVIGNDALIWADRLQPSLRLNSTVSELKKLNIGILQMSPVTDISMAIDSGYEERAQFGLLVSQDTIVKEQLNNILTAEINIKVES